ncbi:MAG: TolC family protein [Bacteroidia bacterium]|nr:TolC family protein [Bacteroidia bacterium]
MKYCIKIVLLLVLIITNNRAAISQSDTVSILKLEICIKAALDYSPDLKEGFIQTEIKKTETSKAKSSQFPYLYSAASYNLTDQNKLDNNYNSVSYGINANQVLWQYGKNKALLEQSKFLYKAELSNYNAKQQNVIVQVNLFYFEYLTYIKLLELAKNNEEQADLFLRAAKEKKAIGIGKNSDILKAESDVADAKYISNIYENVILKVRNELWQLTGLNITENTKVQDDLFITDNKYSTISKDSLFSIAKNSYPELKMMDDLLLSQESYIKSVKSDIFPKISVGAGYNWNYNPLFENNDFWNAGLTISWDIFSGYRKKYQVKIEKLQSNAISFQKENLLLNLCKEINNQFLTLNENYNQIGIIDTLLKSTTENLTVVMEEYKQGISSMLELANARTENFMAKEKYINAWYAYQISKVQLERTLGVTNK